MQSAVTQQIKTLEEDFGTPLFHRDRFLPQRDFPVRSF